MTFWSLTSCNDSPTDKTFHKFHDLDIELDQDMWVVVVSPTKVRPK